MKSNPVYVLSALHVSLQSHSTHCLEQIVLLLANLGSLYFSHQELSNKLKTFKIFEVEPKLCWKLSAHFRHCHKFRGSKNYGPQRVKACVVCLLLYDCSHTAGIAEIVRNSIQYNVCCLSSPVSLQSHRTHHLQHLALLVARRRVILLLLLTTAPGPCSLALAPWRSCCWPWLPWSSSSA